MHTVLGPCSRADKERQNGGVPGLQDCIPNLSTFIWTIKKATQINCFLSWEVLDMVNTEQRAREREKEEKGKRDNLSKTGLKKSQEAQEAGSAQEHTRGWRLSPVPSADSTCRLAASSVENKVI